MAGERILVIEDDPEHVEFLLTRVLSPHGYSVQTANCGLVGVRAAETEPPDLVLLSLCLENETTAELLHELERSGNPPVILMSPPGAEIEALQALRLGVRDALIKPFTEKAMLQAIGRVLHQERLARERDQLVRRLAAANEELENALAKAKTLFSLNLPLASNADLEEAMKAIAQAAVAVTHAEEGFLLLRDQKDEPLYWRTVQGPDDAPATSARVPLAAADRVSKRVLRSGEPLLLTGADHPFVEGSRPARSLVAVPLQPQEEVIGVLGVKNVSVDRDFTRWDVSILSALAGYATLAVHNAQTHARTNQKLGFLVAELAAVRQKADLILQHTAEGVYTLDRELRITSINPAMERITGWRQNEILGRRFDELFAPEREGHRLPAEQTLPGKALKSTNCAVGESTILRKDDRRIPVAGTATPLRDAQDSPAGVLATMRDLTLQAEMQQLREQFVALAAHWLRAPLTQIGSSANVLLQAPLPKDVQREVLSLLQTQNAQLDQLADEMLDVLQVEDGTPPTNAHPVTLKPIIDQVVTSFRGATAGQCFQVTLAPALPFVLGDETKIELALANLVDNTLALNNARQPVVISASADEQQVIVTVAKKETAQNGSPPVPSPSPLHSSPEAVSAWQGDEQSAAIGSPVLARQGSTECPYEGVSTMGRMNSAMGLHIAKRLIQAQGGQIWSDNPTGTSTRFHFSLPRMETKDEEQALIDR